MLESTVSRAGGADTVANAVLRILNTFDNPDEGDDCPQLLVRTQASVKDGQFLLNSKKRNVQTVDNNAFVPFTYGEEGGQSVLCVLVIDKFYLARMGLETTRFATGTLLECDAVAGPGHVTSFWDGTFSV